MRNTETQPLRPRWEQWARLYAACGDATQAARQAGYAAAMPAGRRLLADARVMARAKELREELDRNRPHGEGDVQCTETRHNEDESGVISCKSGEKSGVSGEKCCISCAGAAGCASDDVCAEDGEGGVQCAESRRNEDESGVISCKSGEKSGVSGEKCCISRAGAAGCASEDVCTEDGEGGRHGKAGGVDCEGGDHSLKNGREWPAYGEECPSCGDDEAQSGDICNEPGVAGADEVLRYFTRVMRGEAKATDRERLRAAELLGKRCGVYGDGGERVELVIRVEYANEDTDSAGE